VRERLLMGSSIYFRLVLGSATMPPDSVLLEPVGIHRPLGVLGCNSGSTGHDMVLATNLASPIHPVKIVQLEEAFLLLNPICIDTTPEALRRICARAKDSQLCLSCGKYKV